MVTPTHRDVKRLFALSGNRCAFPRCQAAIAEGTSLIGEICHIKADKPSGPRYDKTQTDEKRQSFDNLILMCANHHKVIDDDEESYPAERLWKLKADHESRSKPVSDSRESDAIVTLLIEHSMLSVGQTGGIAAHTVNAQNIYLNNAPSSGVKVKTTDAVDALWRTIIGLKGGFSNILFLDTIHTTEELNDFFKGKNTVGFFDALRPYDSSIHVVIEMQKLLPKDGDMYRLYVTSRLWAVYQAIICMIGRSAMLITLSFKENELRRWQVDTIIDQHLRAVLPGPLVDAQKRENTGGLQRLLMLLEQAFLKEAATIQRV
jgi:hypothetical protein